MPGCKTCEKELSARNKSGYCAKHVGAAMLHSPEVRAKANRSLRLRFYEDAELRERTTQKLLEVRATPKAKAARRERWMKDQPWLQGNASMPAGSGPRRRAGEKISAQYMAWCPHHLREMYRDLTQSKRVPAAEARQMVEKHAQREMDAIKRELLEQGA